MPGIQLRVADHFCSLVPVQSQRRTVVYQHITLTYNAAEAEAAKDAGVYAVLVDRPGNAPLGEADRERFVVVERLTDLP